MKTRHLVLGGLLVLAGVGFWFGRHTWRVHHQLVSLNVRKASLDEVLKIIERQTHQTIRAERGMNTRITLRVTDKPLSYVLDRLAEQAGARWSTLYAVYGSPKALSALEASLALDGKLETAGWTRLAPSPPEVTDLDGPGGLPQNGPGPQVQALPPDSAPGGRVTSTFEDAVAKSPGPQGAGPNGPPKMFRVFRKGGADGNGPGEQEFWTPEELVMESALNGQLGTHPDDASPETAAQTATKVKGRWTTLYAFRKARLGMGPGLFLQRGPVPGRNGPVVRGDKDVGINSPPGVPPGPNPGDLQENAIRERNEQLARLTPEQRVQRARARQGLDENGKPE